MTLRCPLPVRASVRDLLSDLLARPVTVAPAGVPQELGDVPAYLAAYIRDDGSPAAAAVCDFALAAAAGSAIGSVPRSDADAEVQTGALSTDTREYFREVVNVLAKLLNGPSTPHVRLDAVHDVPGRVTANLAAVVLEPAQRSDYDVTVDGYGAGKLTFLLG